MCPRIGFCSAPILTSYTKLCNFCAPGIWGAMNSLGGGGEESPWLVDAANALTFCLMVGRVLRSPTIRHVLTLRLIGSNLCALRNFCQIPRNPLDANPWSCRVLSIRGWSVLQQQIPYSMGCSVRRCLLRSGRWYLLDGGSGNRSFVPRAVQPRPLLGYMVDVPCWRTGLGRSCQSRT